MSSRPVSSHWRGSWCWPLALAGLASTTTGCGKSAEAPSQDSTAAQRADAPLPPPAYECRAAGRSARPPHRIVHRRSRPDGGAPRRPRRGHRQSDLLLRRQRNAARRRLRDGRGFRGLPEQEAQDQARDQGQRGLRAAAARPDGRGADRGQGRSGRGPGHRPAGAPGDGRLLRPARTNVSEVVVSRPGRAGDRHRRRPLRQGRLRTPGQQRLEGSRRSEREARGEGARRRSSSAKSRGTSRTTTCSRWPTPASSR